MKNFQLKVNTFNSRLLNWHGSLSETWWSSPLLCNGILGASLQGNSWYQLVLTATVCYCTSLSNSDPKINSNAYDSHPFYKTVCTSLRWMFSVCLLCVHAASLQLTFDLHQSCHSMWTPRPISMQYVNELRCTVNGKLIARWFRRTTLMCSSGRVLWVSNVV